MREKHMWFKTLIAFALIIAHSQLANATSVSSGFTLEQTDFAFFGGVSQTNSTWGNFIADPITLFNATGIPKGYVNMHIEELGWSVQNLFVDSSDGFGPISTSFDLGLDTPMNISSLGVSVDYSADPSVLSTAGAFSAVLVGDTLWNAQGFGDQANTEIGAPLSSGAITFQLGGLTTIFGVPAIPNVQAAVNQCFPMAIANSLQYLENNHPNFNVPHDHVQGLRGDNSLVGQLDSLSGRVAGPMRNQGRGVGIIPMLQGKFTYLKNNNLAAKLEQKHQGRGYFVPGGANNLQDGDFTFMGVKSDDRGKKPRFKFIVDQLKMGEDVEIGFSYDNVRGSPIAGHAVRVVEAGTTNGRQWIAFIHDAVQSNDTKGLEVRREWVEDLDKDKFLNVGSLNREIRFVLSESVKEAKAVPEPSTLLLLGTGLAGLGFMRKKLFKKI